MSMKETYLKKSDIERLIDCKFFERNDAEEMEGGCDEFKK